MLKLNGEVSVIIRCCAHKVILVNVGSATYPARVFYAGHPTNLSISWQAVGSVACWKRHKSANYHAATECQDETMNTRMKTILFERQSKTLVGKHRPKIVIKVCLQYFHFPTSSARAENRLQVSRNKRKKDENRIRQFIKPIVTVLLKWGLPKPKCQQMAHRKWVL